MATLITDPRLEQRLLRERRASGGDRFDEVWEGVYLMAPMPNNEHQQLAARFVWVFSEVLQSIPGATVYPGVNVSDRQVDWEQNYRCPDVAVILPGSRAVDHGAYFLGGPDFVIEIVSPGDRSREKLGFYGQAGVRELLVVDRSPWRLELFRLGGSGLERAGASDLGRSSALASEVLPLTFSLATGAPRPIIDVRSSDGSRKWQV
jgi:Uma2 family endonuclease